MDTIQQNRRRMPRFEMQLPVEIQLDERTGVLGVTRDVSASGVYLFLNRTLFNKETLEFTLTFPPEITMVKSLRVRCTGKVIRVDSESPMGLGLAAEIQRYEFLGAAEA